MTAAIQVLSVDTVDSSPCIVVITENHRYIFDVGEGVQRLAVEHRVRLVKVDGIFITRMSASTIAGLPGMSLTMLDAGSKRFSYYGPDGLEDFMRSTRYFMRDIPNATYNANQSVHSSEELLVTSVRLMRAGDGVCTHVAFLCRTPDLKGKLDVNKAAALNVPKGPLLGKLKSGNAVTLSDGTIIHPEDVLLPAEPGRSFIIIPHVDISETYLLTQLLAHLLIQRLLQEDSIALDCIFHLSPRETTQSMEYQEIFRAFTSRLSRNGSHLHHILLGRGHVLSVSSFQASTRYTNKLHITCPWLFPHMELSNGALNLSKDASVNDDANKTDGKYINGYPLLRFHLLPPSKRGVENVEASDAEKILAREISVFQQDVSMISDYLDATSAVEKVRQSHEQQSANFVVSSTGATGEERKVGRNDLNTSGIRIHFLGTGCAVPSKYRNVSGILIQLKATCTSMILDAGEGTWQQMLRIATHHPSQILYSRCDETVSDHNQVCMEKLNPLEQIELNLAQQLRVVWISHPHADHHLGLISIISRRWTILHKYLKISATLDIPATNTTAAIPIVQPLMVIAPVSVLAFLRDYQKLDRNFQEAYRPITVQQYEPLQMLSWTQSDDMLMCWEGTALDFNKCYAAGEMGTDGTNIHDDIADAMVTFVSEVNGIHADEPLHWNVSKRKKLSNDTSMMQLPHTLSQYLSADLPANYAVCEVVCQEMGILSLNSVSVIHCAQAYGIVLCIDLDGKPSTDTAEISHSGLAAAKTTPVPSSNDSMVFKLVYSGDTRPCMHLIEAGLGADLLIHEATFEDEKVDEAVKKNHSTIGEAIELAHAMHAKHLILTHFSQRYPTIPNLMVSDLALSARFPLFAFDYMSVDNHILGWVGTSGAAMKMMKALSYAFIENSNLDVEEKEIE